ncbi:MAG TPA: short-chain dehydrogenase [Bacteroidales bacterium]|nr:short-chain dehydrogenase [Bacteroidales bacterium]
MTKFKNKTVLITGGATGIGKLMAHKILDLGASKMILWDINTEKLAETTAELKESGFNVFSYVVDVADLGQIKQNAQKVKDEVGNVDVLINNAGIVVGKYFHEHTHEDIDFSMKINTSVLMHITKEFLDDMMKKGEGHIVNIASAAGMISNPKMSIYCASKWAAIGWSDSLRLELERIATGVKITTVTPYYISTGMFDGVKSRIIPIVKPETAANKIVRAIQKNRIFIRMPWLVYLLPFSKGILPVRWFDFIIGNGFGVYKTMNEFKGHQK